MTRENHEMLKGIIVRTRLLPDGPRIEVEGPMDDRSYPYDFGAADPHLVAVRRRMIAYCSERGYADAKITPLPSAWGGLFHVSFLRATNEGS